LNEQTPLTLKYSGRPAIVTLRPERIGELNIVGTIGSGSKGYNAL